MSVYKFGIYKVFTLGKLINFTKVAHLWKIFKIRENMVIEIKDSLLSGKIRISINKKEIQYFTIKENKKKKGFEFNYENNHFKIIKKGVKKMDLYLNGEIFKEGKTFTNRNFHKFEKKGFLDKKKIYLDNTINLSNDSTSFSENYLSKKKSTDLRI